MKEPLVSVMMTAYNHAPFIGRAIQGILQQEVSFPYELVIGEDCSTDGTREMVLEYQRKFPDIIRVITSDKNVGMKKNAHRTGKACGGKYIAYCEGDDYWHHPGKLQKQVDYLESHPECGLVYSSCDVYLGRGKRIEDFLKYRKWEMPRTLGISEIVEGKDEFGFCGIFTCTVMVRKMIREQVREADPYLHQSDQFLMGDLQLWAEIATMAELHFIPESLATYNATGESASRSEDIKRTLRFGISGSEVRLYLCRKYDLSARIRDKYESTWCNGSLRLAFFSGNAELSDEVRRRKKGFTWKEWLLYYGGKNRAIYHICRVAALFRALFKKGDIPWL